jgi:hypothetical protein
MTRGGRTLRSWGMMAVMRLFVVLLWLGMMTLLTSPTAAQNACAPSEVGDGTGVYFLALGENCTAAQAEGYTLVAHLVRDDESSEVMVLVDAQHDDADTLEAAQLLAQQVKDGSVDGGTWHDQPPE